jgi:hypothetical protein
MFNQRNRTALEEVYDCVDRGPVSSFSTDGISRWIESCARCYAPAHIIIMKQTSERVKACPRCLVVLGENEVHEEWKQAKPQPERKPLFRNRIRKYMGGM